MERRARPSGAGSSSAKPGTSAAAKQSKDSATDASDVRTRQPSHGAAAEGARPERPARGVGPMNIQLKVGMLGDSAVGKTSLMVKYVENKFDEDYIQTLGINFMEKIISLREQQITFTIFDLGGESEFHSMIPLVCADASAILFMFDLTRRSTLPSIKEWYRQARGFNQSFVPFLVGTKFDQFSAFSVDRQQETVAHARKYARAMKAPLAFTSSSHSINVQKLFKIVLSKRFNLKSNVPMLSQIGEPILEY